jgi:hypothetical protein
VLGSSLGIELGRELCERLGLTLGVKLGILLGTTLGTELGALLGSTLRTELGEALKSGMIILSWHTSHILGEPSSTFIPYNPFPPTFL